MAASIPLSIRPVNVAVLVELTTEVMQRQARLLGVRLAIHIDDQVPDVVDLDREKVGWVITSLVGSALRHVRVPGGRIDVLVGYERSVSTFTIEVRDDGQGIPAAQLGRLLVRDEWRPGNALALLLVEDIAVAHGGRLEIQASTDPRDHFTGIRFVAPA